MLRIARAMLFTLAFAAPILAVAQQIPGRTPVLVELFTSEGCSSCPPADALLAHLLRDQPIPNADIIALGEHVDYWDGLGWHDRFASHAFTDRQFAYTQRLHADDNYTPQMIVDGSSQFVGNDAARALRTIAAAARVSKVALTVTPLPADSSHLAGTVSIGSAAPRAKASLYAAIIQPMASTQVQRGENGGRTLNHVSVVRSLQRIGSLSDAASAPIKFSLPTPSDASTANFRVVVFAQQDGQGAILGASSVHTAAPSSSLAAGAQ